jgi:hypothetical protein
MRLNLVISRSAGSIVTLYLGDDRAAALAAYESATTPGDINEMYSYLEVSRRKIVQSKVVPKRSK